MTGELKQKVSEWVDKNYNHLNEGLQDMLFQALVQFTTENGIQWHDLRKDPNDLPKDDRFVIGVYKVTPFDIAPKVETCCYSETLTGWSDIEGNSLYNEIERWFDPQFKE